MYADEASNLMSEAETNIYTAKNNKALTKFEKNTLKREGKDLKKKALVAYEKAGQYFEKIELYKNAAQCFFTCKDYAKAGDYFEKAFMFQQAAECQKMIGNFKKAAEMFEESTLYLKAFECFQYESDWEGLLLCLNRNKNKFMTQERESLINRYVPIALNSIYQIMSQKGDEENRGKVMEEKYNKKNIDIIEEENESSDEELEESKLQSKDEAKDQNIEENTEDNKEETKAEYNPFDDTVDKGENPANNEQEEEVIITTKEKEGELKDPVLKTNKSVDSDTSGFVMISKDDIKSNFEHLSNFDPEDEFLQSEKSFSVIGSLISKDEDALSEYSDFSLVTDSRVSLIKSFSNVIDTDRDIYIEDMAMQKIIYYISLFSDDVKQYLTKLRSKDGLLQMDNTNAQVDFFELELDNVDDDLIKLILDVLEHFDMFRLCLIICNRYNMKQHVSRYLTSICYKYSNLKLIDSTKILKINDAVFRDNQKQINILANEAIHGMLRLIDPKMIQQQKTEDVAEDSKLMHAECWRYLYYLGFWKKLVYVMDSHSSLQLCFTIGAFEDFRTVYLINYRPELTNEEIKDLISDKTKKWNSEDDTPLVDYLCQKVLLEESIETLDNSNMSQLYKVNAYMNLALKAQAEGDATVSVLNLVHSLQEADRIFVKIMNRGKQGFREENPENDKEDNKHKIHLFDIFLMYGRVFENKSIRSLIKDALAQGYHLKNTLIRILRFLISLVDEPNRMISTFTFSEIDVIFQGLFIPNKIRMPEPSKLFLNSIPHALLNRLSPFFKQLEVIIADFKGDRYNREFIKIAEEYFKSIHSNKIYGYNPLPSTMNKFEATGAGKEHNYLSVQMADLEAEYVQVPLNVCLYWYKKIFYFFISQTLCKENVNEVPAYTSKDLLGNDSYNEILLPHYLKADYMTNLQLYSSNLSLVYKANLGSLVRSQKAHEGCEASNSQLKWYAEMYEQMKANVTRAEELNKIYGRKYGYFQKNQHLKGTEFSKSLNKKLDVKVNKIIEVTETSMELLEPIQKTFGHLEDEFKIGSTEHDYLMQRAYKYLDQFRNYDTLEESDIESIKQVRFSKLIKCVFVLARADRMDVLVKYITKHDNNHSIKDEDGLLQLKKIKSLTQAIEYYKVGKWASSSWQYLRFLQDNYDIMSLSHWLRIFETAWYLAITQTWGSTYHIYLPANALNFVYEDAKVIEYPEDHNQNYHTIQTFEREIDIEDSSKVCADPEQIFLDLLRHFKVAHTEYCSTNEYRFMQKLLISVFNMVSTLVTDCESVSNNLVNCMDYVIKAFSQTEVLQTENIEKFLDYFGDKHVCEQFKADFFDIDDFQKNDALYNDVSEDVHNQYFVMLFIKRSSEDPDAQVQKNWEEYQVMRNQRILKHHKLTRMLAIKVKDYLLHIKTNNLHESDGSLTMNRYNWLALSDKGNARVLISAINNSSYSTEIFSRIEELYDVQNQLMNVFMNHYSIRNSLDTHFVVGKLNDVNQVLNDAREFLTENLTKIYTQKNDESDASFNPFIEIDENNKEKKFVDLSDKEEQTQAVVAELNETLSSESTRLKDILEEWLKSMPEPEALNVGVKQATLSRKLRWEKMLTSGEKVKQLQSIFRMLRSKKK